MRRASPAPGALARPKPSTASPATCFPGTTARLALLALLLLLLPMPRAEAGDEGGAVLTPNDLDFYLWQALQAATAGERLALNHIGVQVRPTAQGWLLIAVLEGYPAHRAGLVRGDLIQSVNGTDWHPVFSFNDADAAPGGFSARPVQYSLRASRSGEDFEVSIVPVFENLFDSYRSAILNSVQQFSAGNKVIGYARLWAMSRATHDLIVYSNLLQELAQCDGLILDLRNSVGYLHLEHLDGVFTSRADYLRLDGAVGWLDALNDAGDHSGGDPYRKPIALLINEATRGGPELLAWQLDKLSRVVTIGAASRGQVGFFVAHDAGRQSLLRYQPATALRVDGNAFEGRGFTPQQAIPYPFEQSTRSDPQFQAAVNILMGII